MTTTLTSKGQVTFPKQIRDSLHLHPGQSVSFAANDLGQLVLLPSNAPKKRIAKDGFDAVRDKAYDQT